MVGNNSVFRGDNAASAHNNDNEHDHTHAHTIRTDNSGITSSTDAPLVEHDQDHSYNHNHDHVHESRETVECRAVEKEVPESPGQCVGNMLLRLLTAKGTHKLHSVSYVYDV